MTSLNANYRFHELYFFKSIKNLNVIYFRQAQNKTTQFGIRNATVCLIKKLFNLCNRTFI